MRIPIVIALVAFGSCTGQPTTPAPSPTYSATETPSPTPEPSPTPAPPITPGECDTPRTLGEGELLPAGVTWENPTPTPAR